ncbi:hypothetical protein NDU88_010578 [Pleurodeles waltl]|uniref:Ig-like domain-containing protein n=1 Tax=Pleurodeles waltl TaxID=8319 RepID=A0AAV7PVA7_PLEWA|nr:hypothetical protein NDU88_010578 [Pleurodeles waltl]
MPRAAPMWVFGLLLAYQVVLGRTDESEERPHDIDFQNTTKKIKIQTGQTITFECATQKKTPIVFFIFTNGNSSDIRCPESSKVVLNDRIEAVCHLEGEDSLRATWTIRQVDKVDNGTQVICSAVGQKNITSFLSVEESTGETVASYVATPIAGPVLGGFLGFLFIFALIVCCLICYARCKRSEDDDEKQIVNSFSNPSWSGNTNSTLEKGSIPNDYEEPERLESTNHSSKHFTVTSTTSGFSENTTDSVSG